MYNLPTPIVVNSVIALLNGIDVDGETMEYIINQVGMRDQIKSQLEGDGYMPESIMDYIADNIVVELESEGVELIEDQTYGINANEIYLEDITLDKYRIKQVVKDVLSDHFTPME